MVSPRPFHAIQRLVGAPGPLVKRLGLRGKELVFFDVEWGSNHEPRASEEDALSTPPRRHLAGSIEVIS